MEAVEKYGKNYKSISEFLGSNKTRMQILYHYNVLNKNNELDKLFNSQEIKEEKPEKIKDEKLDEF